MLCFLFLVAAVKKSLTLAARPLVPPAPHAIGQALNMGGADTVVSRIASEDDPSTELIVRTVDNLPFPVVQREGAQTGTHNDCGAGAKWEDRILDYQNDFNFSSLSLVHNAQSKAISNNRATV